jgi:formylglycine-generating enzyme required for sulfatase activity
MRRLIQWPAFAACLALLVACDRNQSDTATKAADAPVVEITTASGTAMIYLPGGSFTMGSSKGNADETPHKVSVSSFLMDKYEVTSAQYVTAQLPNPSHWHENPKNPVERVRWRDAKQYCNERSLLEKLTPCYNEKTPDWDCDMKANGYRLPTEAEWEYACRAGTDGDYEFGAADKLRQYAWFGENGEKKTHPVGQKKPNRWGLYDLYGNVSEWCEDVYSPAYDPKSPATDPTGPPNTGADVRRVIRGGSWQSSAAQCRSSARQGEKTGDSDACFATDFCGFRCVRRVTEAELAALKAR